MAAPAELNTDIAILGGGIAGLWLLARLRAAGRAAMLFECGSLGGGQTIASQGIIHGGLKYALDLKLSAATEALADSPSRWRACLRGEGEVDLRDARVLAEHHLFWVQRSLLSRMTGFFGARMLKGRVEPLEMPAWPEVLRQSPKVGAVYQLDETVLDVPSVVKALASPLIDCICAIAPDMIPQLDTAGGLAALQVTRPDGGQVSIRARRFVFAAGSGNAAWLRDLGQPGSLAQRRPLHMLLMEGAPGPLYAHCFDSSDKPRLTITSHPSPAGRWVWYIGGQLAEEGVTLDEAALIRHGRTELLAALPRLAIDSCRFAGWRVDRAEGATADGRKPDDVVIQAYGNCIVAWPTKLALAPQLADAVIARLGPAAPAASPQPGNGWSPPPFAAPVWERVSWK